MIREGVAHAEKSPETYNANMHALSFLYLSHLRAKRNGSMAPPQPSPHPPPHFQQPIMPGRPMSHPQHPNVHPMDPLARARSGRN